MKYKIDEISKSPAYMQLYSQLKNDIINSVIKYGEKLPSKRFMASETGTSVITVSHAYGILCDEGYAESKERSGYFVIYRKSDFLPQSSCFNIPLSKKTPEISDESFPFSVFAKTMRNVISKYGERILVKSANQGTKELRYAICNYLARSRNMIVSPHQIVIGSGAEYLYTLIVQLLGRNRIYGIENPSYEKIGYIYKSNEVKCDYLSLGNDGILSSELERTNASVLHITPFRSFPSGITAGASKRSEYINWAKKHNAIIIEDDFDSEFTVSSKYEDTVFSLEPTRHVIYVNTFSKTIAQSMRIGYMVLPSEIANELLSKIEFYSCTVPVFEQYVIAEFITNGDFERHINKVRRKRRQLLKIK